MYPCSIGLTPLGTEVRRGGGAAAGPIEKAGEAKHQHRSEGAVRTGGGGNDSEGGHDPVEATDRDVLTGHHTCVDPRTFSRVHSSPFLCPAW
jgi:hypothetical protein